MCEALVVFLESVNSAKANNGEFVYADAGGGDAVAAVEAGGRCCSGRGVEGFPRGCSGRCGMVVELGAIRGVGLEPLMELLGVKDTIEMLTGAGRGLVGL